MYLFTNPADFFFELFKMNPPPLPRGGRVGGTGLGIIFTSPDTYDVIFYHGAGRGVGGGTVDKKGG